MFYNVRREREDKQKVDAELMTIVSMDIDYYCTDTWEPGIQKKSNQMINNYGTWSFVILCLKKVFLAIF